MMVLGSKRCKKSEKLKRSLIDTVKAAKITKSLSLLKLSHKNIRVVLITDGPSKPYLSFGTLLDIARISVQHVFSLSLSIESHFQC